MPTAPKVIDNKDRKKWFDVLLDRHEGKYIIPRAMVPKIREFIRPFCEPDKHGKGNPPEYVITTLQMDAPDYSCHHAKEYEALNRFKLRVRTYGVPGTAPVFMEIKRKLRGTVVKSRASIPANAWGEHLFKADRVLNLQFKSRGEETAFLEFVRLAREVGARPAVMIRYIRESYFGKFDRYARVTFDRNLMYQPADNQPWDSWGRQGYWRPMDVSLYQSASGSTNAYSGVVLELKTLCNVPDWMVELVTTFDLVRCGHCKYSNAVLQESIFRGTPEPPIFMAEVLGL